MKHFTKSDKLKNVLYDIRGPALLEADRMQEEGYQITRLNIGNPAPFGFNAPDELLQDLIRNLPNAQGYCQSKGIFSARKAVMQYCQRIGIDGVSVDDVFMGNGVSELIVMAMQGLLNNGDEVLIPMPDYPLWTAAVNLSGGKPVHYVCDETAEWIPDIDDIKSKINSNTKGIVIINPNNPTGAVYSKQVLLDIIKLAREHNLIVYSDEIYDKILYDGVKHIPTASLADDILFITMGGISKNYRAAGFRAGWMIISGDKKDSQGYIEGLDMLSSMRLCSNVPAQYVVQTSLGGYQSVDDLCISGGRFYEQRNYTYEHIIDIPGISCVKPKGAFYLFPKIDIKKFNITNDQKFIYDLLVEKKILVVQGTGFNWHSPDHFRIVFLPTVEDLKPAIESMADFFKHYKQQ